MRDLQQLKEIAPREGPIFFLMGKIYKKQKQVEKSVSGVELLSVVAYAVSLSHLFSLLQMDQAVLHFTMAMDFHTKHSAYIKTLLDKVHTATEEDFELS